VRHLRGEVTASALHSGTDRTVSEFSNLCDLACRISRETTPDGSGAGERLAEAGPRSRKDKTDLSGSLRCSNVVNNRG
jgi:hypothetical protein